MHILYLDESGGPYSWNVQKNFVLGGVAIHEGQIYNLTKAMNDLQEKQRRMMRDQKQRIKDLQRL